MKRGQVCSLITLASCVLAAFWWVSSGPSPATPREVFDVTAARPRSTAAQAPQLTPAGPVIPRVPRLGRVVDEGGAPVAQALIGSTSAEVVVARTNAAGEFRLDNVPHAGAQIYVVAPGHADRHLIMPPASEPLTIVLAKQAALRGRLLRPAPRDLLVSLCLPQDAPDDVPFCVARVLLPAGSQPFAFDRLAAGGHELLIELDDRSVMRLPVHLRAGVATDVGEIDPPLAPL